MNTLLTTLIPTFTIAALAAPATAQSQPQDIGLTMDGGVLAVIYGQDCGPMACSPMFGSVVGLGQTRVITHYSAPSTLYVIGFGTPGPCVTVPGFDNHLLLGQPLVVDWGVTSAPPFVPLPCQQGFASTTLTVPPNAPSGIVFRLQSIGVSLTNGTLAFGPAIEATTL